tara:strand:- start:386 stop:622 length:237 start_codon:yes stop_codon:yes gene_type:complete
MVRDRGGRRGRRRGRRGGGRRGRRGGRRRRRRRRRRKMVFLFCVRHLGYNVLARPRRVALENTCAKSTIDEQRSSLHC